MSYFNFPVTNIVNNNKMSVPFASPTKSGSTDGTSTFEMGRKTYVNQYPKLEQPTKKKWIGGNRDASTIATNRRNKAVGKGTLNLDKNGEHQTITYSNNNDVNLIDRRRKFTRSGGATVPPKCRGYIEPIPQTPLLDGYITSKNNITDGGFTVGETITKDMTDDVYTYRFDPNNYPSLFPNDMAPLISDNIWDFEDKPDKTIASYWYDWGNDIFDKWGFFYLYFPIINSYYFPLIDPQNLDDGTLTLQPFFGSYMTLNHGYPVQGIFKMDITFNVPVDFRFGAYGNMGFDSNGEEYDHTYSYEGNELTMYYHHTVQTGKPSESFYVYVIPKNIKDNSSKTYTVNYDGDNMSIVSNVISNGLIVYFSKTNDVKDWIVNDLLVTVF